MLVSTSSTFSPERRPYSAFQSPFLSWARSEHGTRIRKQTNTALRIWKPLSRIHIPKLTEVLLFNLENAKDCAYQQTSFASCFHGLRQHCSQPCSARSPSPSRIRRKWQSAHAGRRKRDKRQDWHAPRCLRTGHETLLR